MARPLQWKYVLTFRAAQHFFCSAWTKRYQCNKWLFTTDRALLRTSLLWRTSLSVRYTFLERHMTADHLLKVLTKTKLRLPICDWGNTALRVFPQLITSLVIRSELFQARFTNRNIIGCCRSNTKNTNNKQIKKNTLRFFRSLRIINASQKTRDEKY